MTNIILKPATDIVAGCVEIYDDVIENSEELIDIAKSKKEWVDAGLISGKEGDSITVNKNVRSNSFLLVDQYSFLVDPKFYEMCKTVWTYADSYAKKYECPFVSTEPAQILRYHPGEFYEAHSDYTSSTPRVISALLYLNDIEDGGETEFINFDIKIKPKAGRLVLFPSNYAYRHAARLPKNGTKYVAVFWMQG